ncbi:hypothetical protein GQ42DRAFT_179239 [Ramicandelaber brevisporus]|nr:hypothetical protein GQ42DRAFT_179239 [Ramicandelaber brevisporus]
MLLEKVKAISQHGWHSLTRIFSSHSSQPFILPYDLLEEIATYPSRQEAALLLTVNSQFHNAFARAVWRELYLDYSLVNRIPASAWQTYGHLVRIATVTFRGPREHFSRIQMPNVVDLTLYLTDRGYSIFEGVELNNLCRLHLNLPRYMWTNIAAVKDVELALRIGRSDHPIAVYWDIYVATQKHVAALDEILASIVNTEQYSFKITARLMPSAPLQHRSKLAEMLTELDLSGTTHGLSFFLGNLDISFPRLVKLTLGYAGFNESRLVGAYDLIPDRFPVLQRMTFVKVSQFDHKVLERVFSHDWPSLSELVFYKDCAIFVYELIANHVPNLQRLVVNGSGEILNINQVAEHIPHLQHLEVDNNVRFEYHINRQPQRQLIKLKSFVFKPTREMTRYFIRQHILDFILHGAPRLELIVLNESCFSKKTLHARRGYVNLSVRTLSIQIGLHRFDISTAKMLIEMFPNLRLLKLKVELKIPRETLVGQSNKILRIEYFK